MRQATFAVLIALAAWAQAAEPLAPRVRVPGESEIKEKLTVSDSSLTSLGMSPKELEEVKEEVKALNDARATLIQQLEDARKNLVAAQKKVNDSVAELAKQEATLRDAIQRRLPVKHRADYPIRSQLEGVIAWLKLTDDQVTQLIDKQKQLLASDPRAQLADAGRTLEARSGPLTAEQRKEYIDLLKSARTFNQQWLANIESVLDDEQKKTWQTRYRRTLHPVGAIGGGGAGL